MLAELSLLVELQWRCEHLKKMSSESSLRVKNASRRVVEHSSDKHDGQRDMGFSMTATTLFGDTHTFTWYTNEHQEEYAN